MYSLYLYSVFSSLYTLLDDPIVFIPLRGLLNPKLLYDDIYYRFYLLKPKLLYDDLMI